MIYFVKKKKKRTTDYVLNLYISSNNKGYQRSWHNLFWKKIDPLTAADMQTSHRRRLHAGNLTVLSTFDMDQLGNLERAP